jgi:mannitol-specific phosphotransferase system IIBC component
VKGHVRDFDFAELKSRKIAVSQHCFACTAGAGSSCQGATA